MPDNQEIWVDAQLDQSVVVELLERQDVSDEQCLRFFFNDLADANEASAREVTELRVWHSCKRLHVRAPSATSGGNCRAHAVAVRQPNLGGLVLQTLQAHEAPGFPPASCSYKGVLTGTQRVSKHREGPNAENVVQVALVGGQLAHHTYMLFCV